MPGSLRCSTLQILSPDLRGCAERPDSMRLGGRRNFRRCDGGEPGGLRRGQTLCSVFGYCERITDCDKKMNTRTPEVPSLVPHEFSPRVQVIKRGREERNCPSGCCFQRQRHGQCRQFGPFAMPSERFGKKRLLIAGRPGYNAGSRNVGQQNVGRST